MSFRHVARVVKAAKQAGSARGMSGTHSIEEEIKEVRTALLAWPFCAQLCGAAHHAECAHLPRLFSKMNKWRTISYACIPGVLALTGYTFATVEHHHATEHVVSSNPTRSSNALAFAAFQASNCSRAVPFA